MAGRLFDQISQAVHLVASSPPGFRMAFATSQKEVTWAVMRHIHEVCQSADVDAVVDHTRLTMTLPGDRVLAVVPMSTDPRGIEVHEYDHDDGLSQRRRDDMVLRKRLPLPIDGDNWVKRRFLSGNG